MLVFWPNILSITSPLIPTTCNTLAGSPPRPRPPSPHGRRKGIPRPLPWGVGNVNQAVAVEVALEPGLGRFCRRWPPDVVVGHVNQAVVVDVAGKRRVGEEAGEGDAGAGVADRGETAGRISRWRTGCPPPKDPCPNAVRIVSICPANGSLGPPRSVYLANARREARFDVDDQVCVGQRIAGGLGVTADGAGRPRPG